MIRPLLAALVLGLFLGFALNNATATADKGPLNQGEHAPGDPIAGMVNVCPDRTIIKTKCMTNVIAQRLRTFVHEFRLNGETVYIIRWGPGAPPKLVQVNE